MKIKEALAITKQLQNKESKTDIEQALIVLTQGYNLRNKITNKPIISQESVNEFFKLIDENGIHTNWELVSIKNVRVYFMEVFRGIYEIPEFPFVSEEIKSIRETVD